MSENEKAVETTPAAETEQFDIEVEELDTVSGGVSVSSLACAACPVSSFSSVANAAAV
ncbi:thiocillin family RiPP [Streptomyces sp. NPDC092296]|uniref:thiocillin family RiPP n=1 Tax=Streptomyces sp. NPDC092296 TaxID=3366012 RepID=UPI00382BEC37